jgi:hypothetical protein
MVKELTVLVAVVLLCTSLGARAQGTYTNGIRGGYGGAATSPRAGNTPAGSTSSTSSGNRNSMGTGGSHSEGALGLTPQLQKELGIKRQQ